MTKVIDGTNAVVGRVASFAAKQALLGEDVAILNCDKMIITGNRSYLVKDLETKRSKIGSGQKGPKISRTSEKIVKRAVRGMLSHRQGRGKDALARIKCYAGIPSEFKEAKDVIKMESKKAKFIAVKELSK